MIGRFIHTLKTPKAIGVRRSAQIPIVYVCVMVVVIKEVSLNRNFQFLWLFGTHNLSG